MVESDYPRAVFHPAHPYNFSDRPRHTKIDAIVLHATVGTWSATIAWFQNPDSHVSAHYIVGKKGTVAQMVPDKARAHHAGISNYLGLRHWNDFSIGIELVNQNDGADPYPRAQITALADLITHLAQKYDIAPDHIVTHAQISTAGKTDPKNFPLDELISTIFATPSQQKGTHS